MVVLLYKGKGKRDEWKSYSGISLLSVTEDLYNIILQLYRMSICTWHRLDLYQVLVVLTKSSDTVIRSALCSVHKSRLPYKVRGYV